MINLTLRQLFGKNAAQDNQTLIIHKSDLPYLTASDNNRAEQLLIAILLQAHKHFEGRFVDPNNEAVTDENNTFITYNNSELYKKMQINYWRRQYLRETYRIQDTFIIHIFLIPPFPTHTEILASNLDYAD